MRTGKKLKNLTLSIDKKMLIMGTGILLLGILLPLVLHDNLFKVSFMLREALWRESFYYLMRAFFRLILMNSLRTTAVYLGSFVMGKAFLLSWKQHSLAYAKIPFMVGVNYLAFELIWLVTGVRYSFGAPALLICLLLTFIQELKWFKTNLSSEIIIIAILFIMTQILNVFTPLNKIFFGGGELSSDLRNMAQLLGFQQELNMLSAALLILVITVFFLLLFFFRSHAMVQQRKEEEYRMREELAKRKIETLELRTYSEIQHVVHDLKTPLTTIIGLSSLSELQSEDPQIREYQDRILRSSEQMNGMIGEILNEEQVRLVSIQGLIKQTSSFASVNEALASIMVYDVRCGDALIKVNQIRFVRALINVIENAYEACQNRPDPRILLKAEETEPDRVRITVEDNGRGIPEEALQRIWTPGFSLKNSSGLGLVFVKNIVERYGGSIRIESQVDKGTKVIIEIRKETELA